MILLILHVGALLLFGTLWIHRRRQPRAADPAAGLVVPSLYLAVALYCIPNIGYVGTATFVHAAAADRTPWLEPLLPGYMAEAVMHGALFFDDFGLLVLSGWDMGLLSPLGGHISGLVNISFFWLIAYAGALLRARRLGAKRVA